MIFSKIVGILKMAIHGLMQAAIFTIPNMLEQDRVQAAQLQEQWMALTSAQSFGHLRLQIPAFLIPKGAPTNGVFLYMQVPQNTPSNKPNNFSAEELLDGTFYVSIADPYTPWASSYIPQAGKLICLNTGFVFDASGTAISESSMFMPLMLDPNATPSSNAGANPVSVYLQSILGKGIAGETSGKTHVSSWKDWLPFGNVDTVDSTPKSNPSLAFLLDEASVDGKKLPAPLFGAALNQFFNPIKIGFASCAIYAEGIEGGTVMTKAGDKAYHECMMNGVNSVEVSQMRGLGNAAGLLNLQNVSVNNLQAVKNLVNARENFITTLTSAKVNLDSSSRKNLLTQKITSLVAANKALIKQNTSALGMAPTTFPNAIDIYIYETVQTPMGQFLINHSAPALQPLVKDYVIFLDSTQQNILPASVAQISQEGKFEYQPNSSIAYMCSLVSGRTYVIGAGSSTTPVFNTSFTDIATNAWNVLSSSITQSHPAIVTQITTMADYAMTLLTDGPYHKNGYTFNKVDLELAPNAEETSIQTTFASLANVGLSTNVPNSVSINNMSVNVLPYAQRKNFINNADGTGILIYKVGGALGVEDDGTPIDDYIIALGEATANTQNGTQSSYIILPLSTLAFPNEDQGSGIVGLVSLVTGRVFDPNYMPISPAWLTSIPYTTSNNQLISTTGNSTLTSGGTAIASVTLPMATAYMPTDFNPYNYVPSSLATFQQQQNVQASLLAAVKSGDNTSIKSAIASLMSFNAKIASGEIPVVPRQPSSQVGGLLYMQPLHWATYPGYMLYAANTTTNTAASGPAGLWIQNSISTTNQQTAIATTSGGSSVGQSLLSALPLATIKEIGTTYNRWANYTWSTNVATDMFEEGPFNVTGANANTVYIYINALDVKQGSFFYQATPGFSIDDLFVVGDLSTAPSSSQSATVQNEFTVDDFSVIGISYTSAQNPAFINLKNGAVLIPNPSASSCAITPPSLCNFYLTSGGTLPIITDIPSVIAESLKQQNVTLSQLNKVDPTLAQKLQAIMFTDKNANLQQVLTQNFFAGRQLLLNPSMQSTYIYAVAAAPNPSDYSNVTSDYSDAIENAWTNASDYWVCYDSKLGKALSAPVNSSTTSMVSLVSGNVYINNSVLPSNTITISLQSMVQGFNIPPSLSSLLTSLSQMFQVEQEKKTIAAQLAAEDNTSQPVSFFKGLIQVPSQSFNNLYTANGEYFLKITTPALTMGGSNSVSVSAQQQNITYFAFNQIGAGQDTGVGYYYPIDAAQNSTTQASNSSVKQAGNKVQAGAVLRGFNLQAMRAHYGVNVKDDGSQSLVLPMTALPLPMMTNDKKLQPGDTGTYMQYLGSLVPEDNAGEKDYYYQNQFAGNFLMRRVSQSKLSAFGAKVTNASQATIKTDYYVDLISGDEYNIDGSPRLEQISVAYPTSKDSNNNTIYNMTNPLFVWSELDLNTNLPTYYALFQNFDNNGYSLLTPQSYGVSYDIQENGSAASTSSNSSASTPVINRYSYQVNEDSSVTILVTPITNGQAGVNAQLGTASTQPAGTTMQTALATALESGSMVSMNVTCVDGSQFAQVPSQPNVYTVNPVDNAYSPFVFTQVIPGVTSSPASSNTANNTAFTSASQIEEFMNATPFVATLTGGLGAGSTSSQVAAPSASDATSYYVCGLMTPQKGLLALAAPYPAIAAPSSSTTAGSTTSSSNSINAGMYYFIANNPDSQSSSTSLWFPSFANNAYSLTMISPQLDSTSSNLSAPVVPPSIQGGIFDYSLTAAATPAASTQSATNTTIFAPTSWTRGSYYLTYFPQQAGSSGLNSVQVPNSSQNVFNFKYSSMSDDQLEAVNNDVQIVVNIQGQSQLVAPIPASSLQGAKYVSASTKVSANAPDDVYYYPGTVGSGGPVAPSSLYQVQGNETVTTGKTTQYAPFNQAAITATPSSTPQPVVAVGSYIDIETGVVYETHNGTLYPLSYTAPRGTREFLKSLLHIAGVKGDGTLVISPAV